MLVLHGRKKKLCGDNSAPDKPISPMLINVFPIAQRCLEPRYEQYHDSSMNDVMTMQHRSCGPVVSKMAAASAAQSTALSKLDLGNECKIGGGG